MNFLVQGLKIKLENLQGPKTYLTHNFKKWLIKYNRR
jgi:hypothetical protein